MNRRAFSRLVIMGNDCGALYIPKAFSFPRTFFVFSKLHSFVCNLKQHPFSLAMSGVFFATAFSSGKDR
jgi:hypothetical protein